jgi:hypothetical protein
MKGFSATRRRRKPGPAIRLSSMAIAFLVIGALYPARERLLGPLGERGRADFEGNAVLCGSFGEGEHRHETKRIGLAGLNRHLADVGLPVLRVNKIE